MSDVCRVRRERERERTGECGRAGVEREVGNREKEEGRRETVIGNG